MNYNSPVVREKLRTREIFYSSRKIFFGGAQFFLRDGAFLLLLHPKYLLYT